MDANAQSRDLKDLRARNRRLGQGLAMLIVSQVLCLLLIVNILGSERTMVVPPTIDKTFWVTRDKGSSSYLEQMGGYVAWLVLDVTPANLDWKKEQLLAWVAPDDYDAMKTRMDVEGERLRRINGTTSFDIKQFATSESDQSVVMTGRLRRQLNGQEIGEAELKSYVARFKFAGGRAHLTAFEEIQYGPNGQVRVIPAVSSAGTR